MPEGKGDVRGEDWLGAADRLLHVTHHCDFVERKYRECTGSTQAGERQRGRGHRLHLREDVGKADALKRTPEHPAGERG